MKRTELNYLFSIEYPWVSFQKPESEADKWMPSYFYTVEKLATKVIRLRGEKMKTMSGLMTEFGAAFQFFDGFGENWLALSDCLSCLDEWMPSESYIILFTHIENILCEENISQLSAMLKTLDEVGEKWSKPIDDNGDFDRIARPFHSHFLLPKDFNETVVSRFRKAAELAKAKIRIGGKVY